MNIEVVYWRLPEQVQAIWDQYPQLYEERTNPIVPLTDMTIDDEGLNV